MTTRITLEDRPLRIVIADGNVGVLSSLQLVLRRERPRWDVVLVSSGREALAELRRRPCDVVVSDLGFADMDGAALLESARAEFPSTIRIVISDTTASDVLERAWKSSHVMVNKSAQHQVLRDAIARAVA